MDETITSWKYQYGLVMQDLRRGHIVDLQNVRTNGLELIDQMTRLIDEIELKLERADNVLFENERQNKA